MINDLKKYVSYLSESAEGKERGKSWILLIFLIIGLFLFNFFYLNYYANRLNFQVQTALSNLLFFKGISPYSQNISSILANYFSTRSWIFKSFTGLYQLPIYQLVFYLPFSIIPDQNWSFSLWLTINQCLFLYSIEAFIELLTWKPKNWLKIVLLGGALITFFGISNILDANTAFIQLFFFVLGLKSLFSEKYIAAGIFLGLVFLDPYNFFIPLLVTLVYIISRKQFETLLWFIISTTLLSLGGLIFDAGWILKMVKNLLLKSAFFPFIDYSHALLNWLTRLIPGDFISFVPILLLIWLFIENSRISKQNSNEFIWFLCLANCINPFFIMREINYAAVLYVFPLIFIIYLWNLHSEGKITNVIYGILFASSIGIPAALIFFPGKLSLLNNFHSIDLINSILMILILYWVRWWVVKPFDYLIHE
jgi:hypothetical protein